MLKLLVAGLGLTNALLPSAHQESIMYQKSATVFRTNIGGPASNALPESVARKLIKETMGPGNWTKLSSYGTKHNGVTHMAFRQHINGIECSNCDFTVNVDKEGRVVTFGYNDVPATAVAAARGVQDHKLLAPEKAIALFAEYADILDSDKLTAVEYTAAKEDGKHKFHFPTLADASKSNGDAKASLKYIFDHDKNELVLSWLVELETEAPHFAFYEAWMHSETGRRVCVHDLVAWDGADTFHAEAKKGGEYDVYTIPDIDPLLGERHVDVDPHDPEASPLGWHDQGNSREFETTAGNNVFAHENWNGNAQWRDNYRPSGGEELSFKFPINFQQEPREYADAAITNLFWWNNIIHDLFWVAGFDEESGNFQENNFGNGGRENDAVQANAQDGAGFNNANMLTPADGIRGRMRMYLWNRVRPMIDGDLDSGIIVHEYAHGITNRLTGGPMNVGCLRGAQSGGMGEGWGDWWATVFLQRAEYTRTDEFPMGLYAAGRGIRPFVYTGTPVSAGVNPQTYDFLNRAGYTGVHAIGSVWCQVLFTVFWDMKDEFGFDPDWYKGTGGNNALHKNVVDGNKLQPCNPNFIQARDAIMAADDVNFGGRHKCTMWKGFAARGVGFRATSNGNTRPVVEDFTLPPECQ